MLLALLLAASSAAPTRTIAIDGTPLAVSVAAEADGSSLRIDLVATSADMQCGLDGAQIVCQAGRASGGKVPVRSLHVDRPLAGRTRAVPTFR